MAIVRKFGLSIFEAFFCTDKGAPKRKTFSAKKAWAFFFCALALYDNVVLQFFTSAHWSMKMATDLKGISLEDGAISAIIMTVFGVVNGLALGALAVYGWAKAKGAA